MHTSAGTCLASSISALFPARATIVFGFPTTKNKLISCVTSVISHGLACNLITVPTTRHKQQEMGKRNQVWGKIHLQ
jgi:hypothetical protein